MESKILYLKLWCAVLCLHTHHVLASMDGRPDYMKQTYGSFEINGEHKPAYGFTACIIPKIDIPNTDLTAQKAALKEYQAFPQDKKFESSDSWSTFLVRSKESMVNPPVILWLHGSEVDCIGDSLPVDEILSKGFALVMVDRFHSERNIEIKSTNYIEGPGFFINDEKYYKIAKNIDGKDYIEINSKDYIEGPEFFKFDTKYYKIETISNITQQEIDKTTKETSWDVQDSFSLVKEIIMVHKMCVELQKRGTKDIILAGHSRGAVLVNACAALDISQMFENCGVKRFVAIGAIPVQMQPLTTKIPIAFVSGEHDTICPPHLMKFYYEEYLKQQSNVAFNIISNQGHSLNKPYNLSMNQILWGGLPAVIKNMNNIKLLRDIFVILVKYSCFHLFDMQDLFIYNPNSRLQFQAI